MIITNAATMDAYEKALDKLKDRILEQADEIEQLREALTNFCDAFEPHTHQERCQICSAAYHEARAALKKKE